MKVNYLPWIVVGLTFIVGYNLFIIERDKKLFQAQPVCSQFVFHPDCK